MATSATLGKRKRRAEPVKRSSVTNDVVAESDNNDDDLKDAFRRAFEAKFKPLPAEKQKKQTKVEVIEETEALSEDESDWSGLSEPELEVQVIEHSIPQRRTEGLSKADFKAFMSSRPPSAPSLTPQTTTKKPTDPTDFSESANLQNDLALQRLLTESHLIDNSSTSLSTSGRNRHKVLDLRSQSLGSKTSAFAQKNMPLAHRRGMQAKASEREETRRREARENGIVLERATKEPGKKKDEGRRERGIGAPSVGRFQGGTLMLSRRDVDSIQGPRGRGEGFRGRGGRGGRGGGAGRGGTRGRGRGAKR